MTLSWFTLIFYILKKRYPQIIFLDKIICLIFVVYICLILLSLISQLYELHYRVVETFNFSLSIICTKKVGQVTFL